MQVYLNFLKKLEQGQVDPVYLFYGEEDYLRRQAVNALTRRFLQEATAQFNFDLVDGEEVTLEKVLSLAETPPLFSFRRLVIVRYAPYFAGRGKKAFPGARPEDGDKKEKHPTEERHFLAYLQNPVLTTCLVFETGHPVDQQGKLFKTLQKVGQVIEFTCCYKEELNRWLLQEVNQAGKKISPLTVGLFINRVGQNMSLLNNELQKLIAYTGERNVIANEDVQQVTVHLVEENIFAIVDALGERRVKKALVGIQDLLTAGEPPPVILVMVARQFRLLLQVKELAGQGAQPVQIGKQLRLPPFVTKKIFAQSKNFSFAQLRQTLEQLLELDVAIKTGNQDFYPAMEKLALSLLAG
jgi:DNA polymerase-3 subunit delta